jgi:hypothetical protein
MCPDMLLHVKHVHGSFIVQLFLVSVLKFENHISVTLQEKYGVCMW